MNEEILSEMTPSETVERLLAESLHKQETDSMQLTMRTLSARGEFARIMSALNKTGNFDLMSPMMSPLASALVQTGCSELGVIGQLMEGTRHLLYEGARKRKSFDMMLDFSLVLMAASGMATGEVEGHIVRIVGSPLAIMVDDDTLMLAEMLHESGVIKGRIVMTAPMTDKDYAEYAEYVELAESEDDFNSVCDFGDKDFADGERNDADDDTDEGDGNKSDAGPDKK